MQPRRPLQVRHVHRTDRALTAPARSRCDSLCSPAFRSSLDGACRRADEVTSAHHDQPCRRCPSPSVESSRMRRGARAREFSAELAPSARTARLAVTLRGRQAADWTNAEASRGWILREHSGAGRVPPGRGGDSASRAMNLSCSSPDGWIRPRASKYCLRPSAGWANPRRRERLSWFRRPVGGPGRH